MFYIGRLSEEFGGALPSTIAQERLSLPEGTLEQIVEYRYYAKAKASLDAASTPAARRQLPRSPLTELAKLIEFEIANEDREAAAAEERRQAEQAHRRRRRKKRSR